jgi:hypothetical protein
MAFVKMAAARHSSNTTAEAMQYITLHLDQQYTIDHMVDQMAGKLKGMLTQQSKLTGVQSVLYAHVQPLPQVRFSLRC